MDTLSLPPWTLSARLDAEVLEFCLGDGRRLAWRARCPADVLDRDGSALWASDLLSMSLAERLATSAPRALNVQFDVALDAIDWEGLKLPGGYCLAERFALGCQPVSNNEAAPVADPPLADGLLTTIVQSSTATAPAASDLPGAPGQAVALDSLGQGWTNETVSAAHVLVLDGVSPGQLLERVSLPLVARLVVLRGRPAAPALALLLDQGAAVFCLADGADGQTQMLDALLLQIGSGASVGEAARWLHHRAAPDRLRARLYGDPQMRFVRQQEPTSRRQVTSLSFDIVGSTTLLQRLGDEAYADLLANVHARCTEVVRHHGGQPDDPQGDDGVMCYFGHPQALEGAAVRAALAGLELVRTASALGVSVRAGIATGLVAIKAGQPVGLSVHHAARLEQHAAPGSVLCSDSARQLIGDAFELQALAKVPTLKGIDAAERAWVVLHARHDALGDQFERSTGLTPMVGREHELSRLDACWRRTQAGGSPLAVVRAEAGMGKSRLVREFRRRLAAGGVKVLECHCRADASASPYLTLSEALRRWLGITSDEPVAAALDKLAAALPGSSRQGEHFALLAALLGLAPQPAHASPGGARLRLMTLLQNWFASFAREQPCCLIVEDWHWVDPSMREFVQRLLQRHDGPPLLVVLTIRANVTADTSTLTGMEGAEPTDLIELTGLPPGAARDMVRLVSADAPLPAGLVWALAARGDGVPLFLEEATRMAVEQGAGRASGPVQALDAVPASLQDLLTARLDGLGPAKQVAQVAAVIGRKFSLALLTALVEARTPELDAAMLGERLAMLEASGLVRARGAGHYVFRHALIRDAAYASLWVRDRLALHGRVVELLQQRWPEVAAMQPELLALHQTEAGQHREALAQWELAASNAAARSAELEAISHLRRALSLVPCIEPGVERDRLALRLQLLLAARLLATEGYGAEAVLHAYSEAERLCDRIGDETARFKVEMGLEAYRFMRADFVPALEHGHRAALIAARSGDVKQRLHAHWGLACTLFHQGELRAAMREMDTGLALYSPALHRMFGVQDPGVMCMAYSSWCLWELGRPDAALARIDLAVAMALEFQHKFSQAVALAYGVSVEMLRGETDAALRRADDCIRVCDEAGFPVWLAITRCMRGRLLCEQGSIRLRPERDARGLRAVVIDRRAGIAPALSGAAGRRIDPGRSLRRSRRLCR